MSARMFLRVSDTEKSTSIILLSYGEELGLYFDDSVTMKNATSISNNQTKAAANGAALEKWCKKDLDSVEKLAKYQNIDVEEVGFNIIIYDSPNYDGEYILSLSSWHKPPSQLNDNTYALKC